MPAKPLSPLEELAGLGMQRGTFETRRESDDAHDSDDDASAPKGPKEHANVVAHLGFNLHAGVTIPAHDDMGRERLCRYGARPPLSLARLRVRKDGNVSYLVKKVGRGRAKHRIMTPVEFLARLSSLIPPPHFPLVRFAGVLAPRSKWRALVVPRRPPVATSDGDGDGAQRPPRVAPCEPVASLAAATPERPSSEAEATEPKLAALAATPAVFAHALAAQSEALEIVAPNVLSMAHWARLDHGELYAAQPRVDWARLLRRTFDLDLKTCAKCGGTLVVRAAVTAPESISRILAGLAQTRAPPHAA